MAVGGSGGGTIANLQVVVGADVAGALLGFQTIQGAISAVVDTVKQFVSSGIEMNSFLESSELQFKTLTGSATAAHDKVSELFDLAAHTPFTFESVTVAARQLEVFGGAALDTEANLRMLGDSAAATAAPIEQVTFWTGRLYSALQAGEPIGMATMWLQRMGVLSAEATQRMKALTDAGASADEVWKAFTDSQGRFTGAMKEQEGTWKGLTSTMSDTFTLLTGEATHSGFVRLEGDIKRVNAALASPEGHQAAQTLNQAFDANVRFAEILATGVERATGTFSGLLQTVGLTTAAVDDMSGHFESAGTTIASVMEASIGEIAKAPPLIDQIRDSWAQAADQADRAALEVGGYRDETYRAVAAQQILTQQIDDARMAAAEAAGDMFTRHPTLDMGVATGGDLRGIDAIMKAQQDAARAAEKAAREQAQAQEKAAREAETAQREAARQSEQANRVAAKQTEQEWTAAHKAVGAAAQQAAKTQVEAIQAVAVAAKSLDLQALGGGAFDAIASGAASASIAMNNLKAAVRSTQTELDRLQEQADRASMIGQQQGIAGQLNDLDTSEKTLPLRQKLLPLEQQMDFLRLAREETTHKERQKQIDKDIAAVQLKIDEIQTQIGVKQREGQARALEQELRVIPYQRQRLWMENDILDVKEKQLDVQMAINNAERATLPSNGVVTPPFFQLTESGWRATPQQGVSVNFNAPVYGSADFDQRVKQAVETLDRTNNLRFTRYAPR